MKTEHRIIFLFVLINFVFGRMFQLFQGIPCLAELLVLSASGATFWFVLSQYIPSFLQWATLQRGSNFVLPFLLGSTALLSGIVNLFFCQGILILFMSQVFGCESSAFEPLSASFTNSLLGNMGCFISLNVLVLHRKRLIPTDLSHSLQRTGTSVGSSYMNLHFAGKVDQVEVSDIHYIQASKNCIIIETGSRKYVKYQSLVSFFKELPAETFIRIHRSTIVNRLHIRNFESNKNGDGWVTLNSDQKLRFSRTYRKNLRA
ncbi:MAG: LytTR family DNA-binding domain-containing protein [Bacteroidota bacterium]